LVNDLKNNLEVLNNFINESLLQEDHIRDLEHFTDKWSGRLAKLNSFLQQRPLTDKWGMDVSHVAMMHIEELEKQNNRYREALEQIKKEETVTRSEERRVGKGDKSKE